MKKKIILLFAAVLLLQACSCTGIRQIADTVLDTTPRKKYVRELPDEVAVGWNNEFDDALVNYTSISLPYGESGTFDNLVPLVYSYAFEISEGEAIEVAVKRDSTERIFIDFLKDDSGAMRLSESTELFAEKITFHPDSGGTYRIIIQPEHKAKSKFFLSINAIPSFAFPVAGKGNSAIQSFWGMDRDGGKRRHEGIDIFAARGTPVVAVSDGYITYTGDRGLGGKQVWMRSALNGKSVYYAHLDKIHVADGARVKQNDTLGFVGSTGNAKGGAPHLHFGIYGMTGAVDPLAYVKRTEKANSFWVNSPRDVVAKKAANLRRSPSVNSEIILEFKAKQSLTALGISGDWMHVVLPTGERGYLHRSLAISGS